MADAGTGDSNISEGQNVCDNGYSAKIGVETDAKVDMGEAAAQLAVGNGHDNCLGERALDTFLAMLIS